MEEKKFAEGVTRSFISTGCLQMCHDDPTIINFLPYIKHKNSGTIKITAARMRTETVSSDEDLEIVQAMNDFFDYDSEDEAAMNAILNL